MIVPTRKELIAQPLYDVRDCDEAMRGVPFFSRSYMTLDDGLAATNMALANQINPDNLFFIDGVALRLFGGSEATKRQVEKGGHARLLIGNKVMWDIAPLAVTAGDGYMLAKEIVISCRSFTLPIREGSRSAHT